MLTYERYIATDVWPQSEQFINRAFQSFLNLVSDTNFGCFRLRATNEYQMRQESMMFDIIHTRMKFQDLKISPFITSAFFNLKWNFTELFEHWHTIQRHRYNGTYYSRNYCHNCLYYSMLVKKKTPTLPSGAVAPLAAKFQPEPALGQLGWPVLELGPGLA